MKTIFSSPFFLIGIVILILALLLFIFKKIKGFIFFILIICGLFSIATGSFSVSDALSWFKDFSFSFFK